MRVKMDKETKIIELTKSLKKLRKTYRDTEKKAKEIKTELECYKIAIDYGEQKKIELEWKNE